MTPKQVAEIVEFILQTKELGTQLSGLPPAKRAEVIKKMEARKKELGL